MIGNAIKFTEHGEVFVSVAKKTDDAHDTRLQFMIKDSGVGIPIEKQKKIFEPFSQADGSITRTYGGTGLGLTLCSKLVPMMGGAMSVESQSGQGSTYHFTVRLPIQGALSLRQLSRVQNLSNRNS